ncbi:MAG: response regulator [Bacteroidales bacterium]|nr:response regulator [Bacteroidales bacterium]
MIVDDEEIIRDGIANSIDWLTHDINIVAQAGNGKEALVKARKYQPNIIITDISMPIMDGITFIKIYLNEFPDTKVIFLTGYDEFSYAKEAVNLHIHEYILKPINAEELTKSVIKITEQINIEKCYLEDHEYKTNLIKENLPILQSRFLEGLVKGEYTKRDLIEIKAAKLNIYIAGPHYQIFLVAIDNFALMFDGVIENESGLLRNSIHKIIQEIVDSFFKGTIVIFGYNTFLGFVNQAIPGKSLIEMFIKIKNKVYQYHRISLTFSYGKIVSELEKLPESTLQAYNALRKKIHKEKGSIISYEEIEMNFQTDPVIYPSKDEKELLEALRMMDKVNLKLELEKIFSNYSSFCDSQALIKNNCLKLIFISIGVLEEFDINIEKYLTRSYQPHIEIEKFDTLKSLKTWLFNSFELFVEVLIKSKNRKYKKIINYSLKYIKENFNKDISLETIATKAYITPGYFSKIFKLETKQNFTEYLNRYRIEKAKKMLKQIDLKIYEVSENVGYHDYKYFSYNFKKITGYSPQEYRNRS